MDHILQGSKHQFRKNHILEIQSQYGIDWFVEAGIYLREQQGELSGQCDERLQFCAKAVDATAKAASIDERTIMYV